MTGSTQIRISDENWMLLNRMKRPGDDFNDVVSRLLDENEESVAEQPAD